MTLFEEWEQWAVNKGRSYAIRSGLLGSNKLSLEEVDQAALLGLLDSTRLFDPSRGNKFPTLAYKRVIGSVKDAFRSSGFWGSRRCKLQQPVEVRVDLHPTELSSDMGMVDNREESEHLINYVKSRLNRTVMRLRFLNNYTLIEIANLLGLSESRVCQIVKSATEEIKQHAFN